MIQVLYIQVLEIYILNGCSNLKINPASYLLKL